MYEIPQTEFDINEVHKERIKYDKVLHDKYHNMKKRCYDSTNKDYKNYGDRGIYICDEWLDNKYAFFEWSMSNGFVKGLEIDRINNDGEYSPDNCHYVTRKQNRANRRDSNGRTKSRGF